MANLRILGILVLTAMGVALTGCDSDRRAVDEDKGATRKSGKITAKIPDTYLDFGPSISADGSIVTFISGRSGALRAYFSGTTAAEPTAKRLSDDASGLGEETQAVVAPGGQYAAIIGRKDGKTDVWLQFLTGIDRADVVRVTNDDAVESQVVISADGTKLAFLARAKGETPTFGSLKFFAVDVGAKTIGSSSVLDLDKSLRFGPEWSDQGSTLLIGQDGDEDGETAFSAIDASSLGAVVKTEVAVADGRRWDYRAGFSVSQAQVFASRVLERTSSPTKVPTVVGAGIEGPDVPRRATTQNFKFDGAAVSAPDKYPGIETTAFDAGTTLLASVVRESYLCVAGGSSKYGRGIIISDLQFDGIARVIPLYFKDTDTWSIKQTACQYTETEGGPSGVPDTLVSEVRINRDATAAAYTIVLTSNFTGRSDGSGADAVPILADSEVRVFRYSTSGGFLHVKIGTNAAPAP